MDTFLFTTKDGVTIPNQFLKAGTDSRQLMVIYPGRGYTIHHPLNHFIAKIGVGMGMDVLALQYRFQVTGENFEMDQFAALQQDVFEMLETFHSANQYESVVSVGKSLGTAVINYTKPVSAAQILLTPVPGAVPEQPAIPTLAVIGTGDPFYTALANTIESTSKSIQWLTLDNANHGLEVDDWSTSIELLKTTLSTCESFLQQHLS